MLPPAADIFMQSVRKIEVDLIVQNGSLMRELFSQKYKDLRKDSLIALFIYVQI
jgi:hypothetical protein